VQSKGSNLKTYLAELDAKERMRLEELKIEESKYDSNIEQTNALRFMAENAKSSEFKSKRSDELEKI
jgi:hypothetical protein